MTHLPHTFLSPLNPKATWGQDGCVQLRSQQALQASASGAAITGMCSESSVGCSCRAVMRPQATGSSPPQGRPGVLGEEGGGGGILGYRDRLRTAEGGAGPTGPGEATRSPPREDRQIARPHPDAAAGGGHGWGRISRPDPRTGGGPAGLGSGSEASRGGAHEPCQRSAAPGPQHPAASAVRTRDGGLLITQKRLSVTAETQGQPGHRDVPSRSEVSSRGGG